MLNSKCIVVRNNQDFKDCECTFKKPSYRGEQTEMKQTGAEFLSLIADKIICGLIRTGLKIWPTKQDE